MKYLILFQFQLNLNSINSEENIYQTYLISLMFVINYSI